MTSSPRMTPGFQPSRGGSSCFTGDRPRNDITIDQALNTARMSGVVPQGPCADRPFSGEFDTSLLKGGGKCAAGALFGGVRSAGFKGHFSIG